MNQTQAHLCLSDWNPIGNHTPYIQEPSKTHTCSRLLSQAYHIQTCTVCGMPVREGIPLCTATCSICTRKVGVKGTHTHAYIYIFIHTFNSCSHPLKPLYKNPTSFPKRPSHLSPTAHPHPCQIEQDQILGPTGLNQPL